MHRDADREENDARATPPTSMRRKRERRELTDTRACLIVDIEPTTVTPPSSMTMIDDEATHNDVLQYLTSSADAAAPAPGERKGNDAKKEYDDRDDREYVVEKIVASRRNKYGEKEVRVKWLGYDNRFNLWIPARNLRDA
jgi:hypothetical protein